MIIISMILSMILYSSIVTNAFGFWGVGPFFVLQGSGIFQGRAPPTAMGHGGSPPAAPMGPHPGRRRPAGLPVRAVRDRPRATEEEFLAAI